MCCSLSVVCCWLVGVWCVWVVSCVLFVVCCFGCGVFLCLMIVVCCSVFGVCCLGVCSWRFWQLLFVVWSLLFGFYCFELGARRLLFLVSMFGVCWRLRFAVSVYVVHCSVSGVLRF